MFTINIMNFYTFILIRDIIKIKIVRYIITTNELYLCNWGFNCTLGSEL